MSEPNLDASRLADRRLAMARERDVLIARAREITGDDKLFVPPNEEDWRAAVVDGVAIVVNVSPWRCDALVVDGDGIDHVPLPGLAPDDVGLAVRTYLATLAAYDNKVAALLSARRDYQLAPSHAHASRVSEARAALRQAEQLHDEILDSTAGLLWTGLAQPVLDHLGITGPVAPHERRRLWWCPTGSLALLPLHAAGHHPAGDAATVLHRVVSSYTPSLRALVEAQRPTASTGDPQMLFVGSDGPTGSPRLASIAEEQAVLAQHFGPQLQSLVDSEATRDAVAAAITRCRWVHFSGHGTQVLDDPSQGALLLYDRPLTITDLQRGRHSGEFAFLSACKTAVGGINLLDETITLTAALHHTGYRHIIGTLWSIYDDTSPVIAHAVYRRLCATGGFAPDEAARALHDAVVELRDGRGLPLRSWSPFTHTGP